MLGVSCKLVPGIKIQHETTLPNKGQIDLKIKHGIDQFNLSTG